MGISIPLSLAILYTTSVAFTPSHTVFVSFKACDSGWPLPILYPQFQFLDNSDVQVTIKSPIPLNPKKVSSSAPKAFPNLIISTIPRVIKAAFELEPNPRPLLIPAAMAIMFFKMIRV